LRVRRYVDGEQLDERYMTRDDDAVLGTADAAWAAEITRTGRSFVIVIDDPDGEIPPMRIVGGAS
jgi:hypothetical protein